MPSPLPTSSDQDCDLNCLTITELEKLAAERMDKQTRDYYNEGADDGSKLNENTFAYNKYRIRSWVLRGVSQIDIAVPLSVAGIVCRLALHL
jgi:(S)-2-hydroxy-acid oxidase